VRKSLAAEFPWITEVPLWLDGALAGGSRSAANLSLHGSDR